jgi:hypothetical protein
VPWLSRECDLEAGDNGIEIRIGCGGCPPEAPDNGVSIRTLNFDIVVSNDREND